MYVFFFFFTDSSFQASQQGTKTQGVTKEDEKGIIETKENISTTGPRCETSNYFTHLTAKAAVVLLSGRSLPQAAYVEAPR